MSRRHLSKQKSRGEENDFMLAFARASSSIAAERNRVQQPATGVNATAAAYTAIGSEIVVKASGQFLVEVDLNVSINGGTLADGDAVVCTLLRNSTPIGEVIVAPASTATGAPAGSTVTARVVTSWIDPSGASVGTEVQYGLQVTSANGHTSGVVAGQGFIRLSEIVA